MQCDRKRRWVIVAVNNENLQTRVSHRQRLTTRRSLTIDKKNTRRSTGGHQLQLNLYDITSTQQQQQPQHHHHSRHLLSTYSVLSTQVVRDTSMIDTVSSVHNATAPINHFVRVNLANRNIVQNLLVSDS